MTQQVSRADRDRFATALAAAEAGPTAAELDAAPVIENWMPTRDLPTGRRPILIGEVAAHPVLWGERTITTSAVVAIDTEAGFARTQSRFYRLGTPAADVDPAQMTEKMREAAGFLFAETLADFGRLIEAERALLEHAISLAPCDA